MRKLITICAVIVFFNVNYAKGVDWIPLDASTHWVGAHDTFANGISGSNIIGYYSDAFNVQHGFLYNGGNWNTLDKPDAATTNPYGISGNNIVGIYSISQGDGHGFLYNGTTWSNIDKPDAAWTNPSAIDGSNIVGNYGDSAGYHGFLYNGGNWDTLDLDRNGVSHVNLIGISGNNIVGSYSDALNNQYGFLYNRVTTTWTSINASDYVSGTTDTFATGINGNNIVGCYITSDNIQHGFLYDITDPNPWTLINDIGVHVTYPTGIDGSNIVGYYVSSPAQGFLKTIPEPGTITMLAATGLFLFFGALGRYWFKK